MSVILLPLPHLHAIFHGFETLKVLSAGKKVPLVEALESSISNQASEVITQFLSSLNFTLENLSFAESLKAYFIGLNILSAKNDHNENVIHMGALAHKIQDLATPKDLPQVQPYDLFALIDALSYNIEVVGELKAPFNEVLYIVRHALIASLKGEDLELNLVSALKDIDVIQAMNYIKLERDEDPITILDVQNEILMAVGIRPQFRGTTKLTSDDVDAELHKLDVLNKLSFITYERKISYAQQIENELVRAFNPYFAASPANGTGLWGIDDYKALSFRTEYPPHWCYRKNAIHPRLLEIEKRVCSIFF